MNQNQTGQAEKRLSSPHFMVWIHFMQFYFHFPYRKCVIVKENNVNENLG